MYHSGGPARGACGAVLIGLLMTGCSGIRNSDLDAPPLDTGSNHLPRPGPALTGSPPAFTDVTSSAGIHFQHETGAFGQKWMPETMGSGCAFLDYDDDGQEDILLVNSRSWPGHDRPGSTAATMKLYRNLGGGRFADVTASMGLDHLLYGMGVAVGDYDNDGWDDLFITCLGGSHLFHNERGKRFVDVTSRSGLNDQGWSTSACWIDYDRSGLLDLFVCHYVEWTPQTDISVSVDGVHKSYATPEPYRGESCRLYHNDGHGKFTDVTERAGIYSSHSKALSVVPLDYNGDGWPDLFVANDTQPNFLYQNRGDGRFKQVALEAAVAVSEQGKARAGMGCDAADYDSSGRLSLGVSNFSGEQIALYHNDGGIFTDRSAESGVGPASERFLGFGLLFVDYDLDGKPDLFVNDGHVLDDIGVKMTDVGYRERPLLYHNEGGGHFVECAPAAGPLFITSRVGRGAARGDFNNDGAPDLLLTTNQDGAALFRNDLHTGSHWVGLRLVGAASNRDGYGAMVTLETADGRQLRQCSAAGSYLSSMDPRMVFGLGHTASVRRITIRWPSGRVQSLPPPPLDRYTTVTES